MHQFGSKDIHDAHDMLALLELPFIVVFVLPALHSCRHIHRTHVQESFHGLIGAFGHFSPDILARANVIWSLSKLVFPHQICRLIVTEQIYRAQEIYLGHAYHHA